MMSQQQNPLVVSRSPLQEIDSEKTNTEADVKPFSIREYALASRYRNINQSWPFPEKYLHMCLNRGIRDVLPPFGPQATSPSASSLKCCCSSLMQPQDGDTSSKVVDDLYKTEEAAKYTQKDVKNYEIISGLLLSDGRGSIKVTCNNHSSSHEEEGNYNIQHNFSVSVSSNIADHALISHPTSSIHHVHKSTRTPTTTLAVLSEAVKSDKRRRRRRGNRCKKRSMVDILAVARRCTPEEIIRMNKFFYYNTDNTVNNIEVCHQKIMEPNFGNVSKSEVKGDDPEEYYSYRNIAGIGGGREEDQEVAASFGISGKGSMLVKFKVNGCIVAEHE